MCTSWNSIAFHQLHQKLVTSMYCSLHWHHSTPTIDNIWVFTQCISLVSFSYFWVYLVQHGKMVKNYITIIRQHIHISKTHISLFDYHKYVINSLFRSMQIIIQLAHLKNINITGSCKVPHPLQRLLGRPHNLLITPANLFTFPPIDWDRNWHRPC